MDCIKRAIGLIGWMEVDDVQPYYCEGLIHLCGMFESNVLKWQNDTLSIDQSVHSIDNLKKWYIDTYTKLATIYLKKQDALEFLNDYVKKDEKYFLPKDENIKNFVQFYFKRYQDIGQELDTSDRKENYIK
jgi:hypothetical protein